MESVEEEEAEAGSLDLLKAGWAEGELLNGVLPLGSDACWLLNAATLCSSSSRAIRAFVATNPAYPFVIVPFYTPSTTQVCDQHSPD